MVESSCKNNTNSTNFSQDEIQKEYEACVKKVQAALKQGIVGQLKEPRISFIFRAIPQNQQESYKILAKTQSSTQSQCIEDEYTKCGEKEEGTNQQPESNNEYNVQFIVENTSTTDYHLLVIPNYENATYDFSNLNNTSKRFLGDDIEELEELDLTDSIDNSDNIPSDFATEMDNGLQLNIMRCQVLRTGIVPKCWWPINMNSSLLAIAMEALNQYTPILDKQYSTIKTEQYSGTLRILESSEVLQKEQTPFKVENEITGSYKKKNEIIIQEQIGANNTNGTSLKMQNSFEQKDFGKLYGSGESKEMLYGVEGSSTMDPVTGQISESQSAGQFNFKGGDSNSSENNNTQSIKKLDVNYEVKLELTESKQLDPTQVELILNISKILKFKEIIDPINNKTFLSSAGAGFSEEDTDPEELRFLASYDEIASLMFSMFKQNLIGIDVTGGIDVKCYENDQCFIGIFLDLGGVIKYYPIRKKFEAKISSINSRYQYLKYYVLDNVIKACDQLVKTKTDFYSDAFAIVTYFQKVGDRMIDPLKSTSAKYNNILSKLTQNFGSLSDLVPNMKSVIQKEFRKSVSKLFGKYYLEKDKFTQILLKMESYMNQTKELLSKVQLEENDQVLQNIKQFQSELKSSLLDYISNSINTKLDTITSQFDSFNTMITDQFEQIANTSDIIPDYNLGQTILSFFTERLEPFKDLSGKLISKYTENIKLLINIEHSLFETQLDQYFDDLYSFASSTKEKSEALSFEATNIITEFFSIDEIQTLKYSGIGTLYELDVDIKESLKGIITAGFTTFYTGMKQMFVDSKNIFSEIYDNFGEDATNIKDNFINEFKNFVPGFQKTISTAWNNLATNVKDISSTFKEISKLSFTPGKGDVKKIMKGNLFSAPDDLKKTFRSLKSVWTAFSSIGNDLGGLLQGEEIFGSRRLGILDIFGDLKDSLTNELNNLKISFQKAKDEMINLSEIMNVADYTIDTFNFDSVKDILTSVAEDIGSQIINEVKERIQDKAQEFIKDQFADLFNLEDLLETALTSFLPGKSELLYRLGQEWRKSVTLGVIPIVIGVVKVDAYIKYFHAIDITYGFEGGALFIGVSPHAGVVLGLTAYADFFILRMGMFVEGTLFEGSVDFKLGIQVLNKLSAFYYCDLSIEALKFAVGAQYQFIYITLKWKCWRIKLWFIKIRLCIPIIVFAWTPWKDMFRFEIIGFSYKRPLIPRKQIDLIK